MRLTGVVGVGLLVWLTAGCQTDAPRAAAPKSSTTVATPAAVGTSATSGVPSAPRGSRLARAVSSMRAAKSVRFSVTSDLAVPGFRVRTVRDVRVDVSRNRQHVRVVMTPSEGKEAGKKLETDVVVTSKAYYLTMPSWTDARRGKWLRFTGSAMVNAGIPAPDRANTTAVPLGVAEFTADRGADGTGASITGTVDAASGMNLLGMQTALSKDARLSDTLAGRIPAVLTFKPSGAIASLTVSGRGHSVTGSSTTTPMDYLQEMITGATAKLTVADVGGPVDIIVPPRSKIYRD
ncbi:hypothetical protein [Luteipulveratus flavus]|uniref:Lipoprotein n=1 Tax=Luteipulveratus flavus TaxID=3031728 RepID=A0ABT6CDV1_9MICO|nr:hypothetical protein [Luteipulveratus sp. YIM 133296]MDF8266457.1 hypothetical protein [Luteipulveratus sp. YIM 133296]